MSAPNIDGRSEVAISQHQLCSCNSKENVDHYCERCRVFVCNKCIPTKHPRHRPQKVETLAQQIRQNVTAKLVSEKTNEKLSFIDKERENAGNTKTKLSTVETNVIAEIEEHTTRLHEEIDKIRDLLLNEVTENVNETTRSLDNTERKLDKSASSMRKLLDTANDILSESDDMVVVKSGLSICEEMEETFTIDMTPSDNHSTFDLVFLPGDIDQNKLKSVSGQVSL